MKKLTCRAGVYEGTGMLVESPDLGEEFIIIGKSHESMQRIAEKLRMKYDTTKASKLKIKKA